MFQVKTAQENHFQIATTITDQNLPIEKIFVEDLQTEEIHKIIHKLDIVYQIVKITNIAIITQDQTHLEVFTQIIIESF